MISFCKMQLERFLLYLTCSIPLGFVSMLYFSFSLWSSLWSIFLCIKIYFLDLEKLGNHFVGHSRHECVWFVWDVWFTKYNVILWYKRHFCWILYNFMKFTLNFRSKCRIFKIALLDHYFISNTNTNHEVEDDFRFETTTDLIPFNIIQSAKAKH